MWYHKSLGGRSLVMETPPLNSLPLPSSFGGAFLCDAQCSNVDCSAPDDPGRGTISHFSLEHPVLSVGGSSCLICSGGSSPGRQATFHRMIQSWVLWPLLLVQPQLIQSRASGLRFFLDDPSRGVWSHFAR